MRVEMVVDAGNTRSTTVSRSGRFMDGTAVIVTVIAGYVIVAFFAYRVGHARGVSRVWQTMHKAGSRITKKDITG